jgi:curved DNA-binding protein CbpA
MARNEQITPPMGAYVDPYAVLGLTRAAGADEIRQAYFNLVRLHPPEREPAEFKRIRAAYDQLRAPDKRIEADMRLIEDWPEPVKAFPAPEVDTAIAPEDVLALLRACTDVTNRKAQQDYREVRL